MSVSQEKDIVVVLKDIPGSAPIFQERSNAYDLGRALPPAPGRAPTQTRTAGPDEPAG